MRAMLSEKCVPNQRQPHPQPLLLQNRSSKTMMIQMQLSPSKRLQRQFISGVPPSTKNQNRSSAGTRRALSIHITILWGGGLLCDRRIENFLSSAGFRHRTSEFVGQDQSSCSASAFRNACAARYESVGITFEAPQERQVTRT